jgi:ribosome-binding factor A
VAAYFDRHRARIRSQVGRNLHVRYIPELVFTYDPSIEHGARIEQLLDEIKSEKREDKS